MRMYTYPSTKPDSRSISKISMYFHWQRLKELRLHRLREKAPLKGSATGIEHSSLCVLSSESKKPVSKSQPGIGVSSIISDIDPICPIKLCRAHSDIDPICPIKYGVGPTATACCGAVRTKSTKQVKNVRVPYRKQPMQRSSLVLVYGNE